MPSIQNQSMTIQPAATGVRVTVGYTATFSAIEIFLMRNGLVIEERIHLLGDDEARAGTTPVWTSPPEPLVLPVGDTVLVRSRDFTLARSSLQEDPSQPQYAIFPTGDVWWSGRPILIGYKPDDDELLARVVLTYVGLQNATVAETPVRVLVG